MRNKEGFNSDIFKTLAELEESNFWFLARNELIIYLISRYFPGFSSFLEVGCGTGFVLSGIAKAFPGRRLAGIELFEQGLIFARQRLPEAVFHHLDARSMSFESGYDLVGSFDVLEHIQEDQDVLKNIHKALKPGGGLLVAVPQHQWLWSPADEAACHVRRYGAADLHRKLLEAGFELIRSLSFVSLLLPLMFASRAMKRLRNVPGDQGGELNPPVWLNKALGQVLGWERLLIKAGFNFPWGGSRVVVAKRP